jgi:L-malate glycosyltransferase
MRIVHLLSSLKIGGAERLAVDLACAQLRAGLDVSIIELGGDEQELAAHARRIGVKVFGVGQLRSKIARVSALGALLAGRDLVLHIHNPWALRAVLPILPAIRGRVIYTRHGASPYCSLTWRTVHRLARGFVDRVTFVTEEAKDAFEAVHGASPGRHVVVEKGVAVASSAPARILSSARLRVGSVGRLVELKGQRHTLAAVSSLAGGARERVEIHMFGDGPERERLTDYARASLADVPVSFHGMVIDRDEIYEAIDLLVVASRTEGQSLAIMEAMARGIPVIATNVGGNPQLVRDGETGMLVPAGDSGAIRDRLARVLAEPELLPRLGRASHARIVAHHSIETMAEKYRGLYVL